MNDRAADHNPDIAVELHLRALGEVRASGDRRGRKATRSIEDGLFGAVEELQLWARALSAGLADVHGRLGGIDGQLRRLEAAAASDDVALDELRTMIIDIRADVETCIESTPPAET